MIGAGREGGLIADPPERANQGKQVDTVNVSSGLSLGLSTEQ